MGASGRLVGKVVGDTLIKNVRGSRHFLRTPPAIAFDEVAIKAAEEAGATVIQVNDLDSGLRYRASMPYFLVRSFEVDRGFGKQLALILIDWGISKDGRATADKEQPKAKKKAPPEEQGSLF